MQPSDLPSPLENRSFSTFSNAYTQLFVASRNNLYKAIKYQLILLYGLHFFLNALIYKDFKSNAIICIFFTSFLIIFLQRNTHEILHHINAVFLISFTILLFSNGSYTQKVGIYLPQLSLLATNNRYFAVFLQLLILFSSTIFRIDRFPLIELYFSSLLVSVLAIMLYILRNTNLKFENLKAHADSLEAQLRSAEALLKESKNFNKDFHLTISHEFRNPLNNLMGNLDLAQKELAPEDPNHGHLRMAKLGGEILLNSLNNALDFCKAELDEIEIHFVSVNIRKCLEKSWNVFSELLKLRGLHGELYLHANVPPFVMIDPGRLHQILLNLVHNSSKFTSEGFVKIIISWHPCVVTKSETSISSNTSNQSQSHLSEPSHKRTATPDLAKIKHPKADESFNEEDFAEHPCGSQKITFSPSMNYHKLDMQNKKFPRMHRRKVPSLSVEGIGYLKIQIIDSGIGIHSHNLPKMFEKFSRFSLDSIPRVEGSGLSLWITKKICSKMDGSIHVYSDYKKGSTFLVFLKCEVSPQSLGTPTPSPCLSDRRNRSNLQTMGTMPILTIRPPNGTLNANGTKKDDTLTSLRVMVVDDIPYNQELNKKFLEICGSQIKHIAENGLEAYKYFTSTQAKEPLDVVFMDLDMPVMDGKTSSMKIREWEKKYQTKPVVIVILTANCSESELRFCLDKSGPVKADYFYRKPLSLSDCQNLIKQITREKTKKKAAIGFSLPKLADHVLLYEKDLFQQVLLENYLRVGQIKHFIANKDNSLDRFMKFVDTICVVLYNCEDSEERFQECKRFIGEAQDYLKKKGKKDIPILGIIKEADQQHVPKLKSIGFRDFLVKPFDYENIIKLLRSHTMNNLPI